MSRRSSERGTTAEVDGPLRPSDHLDKTGDERPVFSGGQPALGVVGWLRWGWRQLTSMRTALVLLLLLAIAAIPGSLVPQRSADPNGVSQWRVTNPDLFPTFDALQLFDVYTSVWFSAIYILLFISLIGCVLPRTKHHWKALRQRPPRTPARLARLDDRAQASVALPEGEDAAGYAAHAVDLAEAQLRSARYRVERYDARGVASVSAERGYLRETGNLLFHGALVGILISVGIGGGFTYTGQTVITEGDGFVNSLGLGYTSFNPGRFVDTEALPPYSIALDEFDVTYAEPGTPGAGQAGDFAAHVTTRFPGQDAESQVIRVNHPITMAGDRIYLMGNGYAPTITVRNGAGDVVFSEAVPFLPQSATMTSQGVVKVPDTGGEQLGMVGFFYPTAGALDSGALTSIYGDLVNPRLTFWVYEGDLGIDDGTPRSVYALNTDDMTQIAGNESDVDSLELVPGQTVDLPGGRGTVTFEDETRAGAPESVKRYISLSIHNDSSATWVLVFAILALLGLFTALFVPRRRMWVKATPEGDTVRLEYAGLARGEDPAIAVAVADLARQHRAALGGSETGTDEASAPARDTRANVD
ncbi:cytochrome c biogenesis protein ResB [Microbacterium sp. EYE_5]|uniref:cytochrome c biogenesis protein ResB n=1 Tax=unclassified Microbacterium TaxID=2609290 RepID=UPI0020029C74|nr:MULTISPECIES: cytochrome c biogenesis protein ResB [unclassified Microbacterium]MCK6080146.1 cytochrome c biogenesis protein ResB [Microbacterium sp. EYE_382]MCK6085417.1 cytochrome c biogenesis protein ResB [Microbacterium sp. EYE_384]MCK6122358.1 cytochrome c biogenesis protein ResB [Microbacterium sp. EYE_80]MCK6126180.1 cytochrome c biogenesis protein ResB [Microbacterium sp. EYE_79]MCK6141101.1 cytochrome c biogenesis protein ResB [Microbacterium sp. EYE_39]